MRSADRAGDLIGVAGRPGKGSRLASWPSVRANPAERLAQIAGVRPRTFETHFKMFLGTTPLGWVRRMRLARARQEMLHPAPKDADHRCCT